MKNENPVQEKSYALALRIVELYKYLTEEKKEFVLSKLNDSGYLEKNPPESLFHDIEEILKLLGSIQKTMKHKIRNS